MLRSRRRHADRYGHRGLTAAGILALTLTGVPAQVEPAVAAPVVHVAPAVRTAPFTTVPATATATDAESIDTARVTRPVAPGVELISFDRLDSLGWLRADVLSVDLTGGSTVEYLFPGHVAATEPVSTQATRIGAVAAINGDFFDINNSGAARGVGIQDGELIQAPVNGHHNAIGITPDGLGRVLQVFFEGTATLPDGTVPLTQFNTYAIQPEGVGVFTSLWGDYPRAQAVAGATEVTEVVLTDGVVTSVTSTAGSGPIPSDSLILLGREAGARALATLRPGDRVTVEYRPRTTENVALQTALGGNHILVVNGQAQHFTDTAVHPRTAVGFSADGTRMFLLTVDGRQAASRGVTLDELADMMVELGAYNALNLDGGGSSTLVVREPGSEQLEIANSPSDGGERPVPNGLAILAPEGSGRLTGFWVETAIDPLTAATDAPVPGGRPDRVFPGLSRRLTASGYDETYGPAEGTPRWRTNNGAAGNVDNSGVFRARRSGEVTVTAYRGNAVGSIDLTVLGPLARIDATTERLSLAGAGAAASFGVVGYDATGTTAPIEPADVRLEYDDSLLTITAQPDGSFQVSARQEIGSGLITVHVGEHTTVVPVTIGLQEVVIADFEDSETWTASCARCTATVETDPSGYHGEGLRLSYDFTQSTATRAAYANPAQWIEVPGQPQSFSLWIHGAGNGEWPSLHLVDALDQDIVLRGPYVTWEGWRQVELTVPTGVAYPVRIRRFYVAETAASASYHGEVRIDELIARVPPSVQTPPEPVVVDPVVSTPEDVAGRDWRFAVLSDAQFIAADPDSEFVAQARRTLREIRAANPDFVVINGDFVDTGYPADFDLARRLLEEELGDQVPWYYIPGNHEIYGPGDTSNFRQEFGDTYRTFDHRGTRFILLDSSTGTLRGGGFAQVHMLREALDDAASSREIGSVVVMFHHPPRDPTPAQASQLGDRYEAALIEQWLADFRRTTGKGVLVINSHVGTFAASHVDGVPYLINGNAGKNPATPADQGGFTGWSLIGVDELTERQARSCRRDPYAGCADWVAVEVRPHVDTLRLEAPPRVTAGTTVQLTATVLQHERQVPVAYPVSAQWEGSANLIIGPASAARHRHVAAFDPVTGELHAFRPGTIILSVTVNGVTHQATITVTR